MHVLIDAMAARLGGNITVLKNLLASLCEVDSGRHRYTVLGRESARHHFASHDRVGFRTAKFAERNMLARLTWEQLAIAAESAFGDVDLVFAPSGLAVFASRKPQILMFQNALPFDPDAAGKLSRAERLRLDALRVLGIASARAADRVVFISHFAQELILPSLGIAEAKAQTIHLGRDPLFSPAAKSPSAALCARLNLTAPHLLSVSHFYSYKNIVELVQAFALALPNLPPTMRLLLAGAEHERGYSLRVRETVRSLGLQARVELIGEIDYADLPALYAGAAACVFPSQCESFPNILIEGMACGAPTLCSSAGPMPELAGDGARYFDGQNPRSIADAMIQLFADPKLAIELSQKGIAQAARYSWNETARHMLSLFEATAAAKSHGATRMHTNDLDGTARYFGGLASGWGSRYAKSSFSERRDFVRRWLSDRTPGLLVDVGCGSGKLAEVARESGWRVVGLDLSREMLQAARDSGVGLLANCDAARLSLRSEFADAVLCISALEYVERPSQVIAELARILKPGGALLLSVANRGSALRKLEGFVASLRRRQILPRQVAARLSHLEYLDYARSQLSDGELCDLLRHDGFELEGLGHFTPSWMPGSGLSIAGMNTYAMARRGPLR